MNKFCYGKFHLNIGNSFVTVPLVKKPNLKKNIFLLFALAMCYQAFSQSDSVFIRKLADEILLHSQAYENLHYLTKNIGARLAGSKGMYNAEQWGYQALQNAGSEHTFKQECLVPHWERGGKDEVWALSASSGKKNLEALALGNSIGTGGRTVEGEVVMVNSFDELEAARDRVKGKIVFYNYHFNPTFIRTFESYADAVKYRGQGPSRAAKYGAVGVIIRSMSHSVDNHAHTGSTRYDSNFAKIPAAAIGLRDADWLAKELLVSPALRIGIKTNGYFLPDAKGHNIIGELKGTIYPHEYITVGGHLDSWDIGEGAHDDGAGITQTIEILRAFKAMGYKPRHTIRFVLFANEENGGRGGKQYAKEAVAKNEKHVFALESDAGGFTPRGFGLECNPEQRKKVLSWLPLLKPYGVSELGYGGGLDVSFIHDELGVPMGELLPDSQRYFDLHHAQNDVLEAVNKRELELGAINMAALIYLIDQYGL